MNCPSRTEDNFEHPTWNQNPPFLAADITTRADLNGIANARTHLRDGQDASLGLEHDKRSWHGDFGTRLSPHTTGKRWPGGPTPSMQTHLVGEDQVRPRLRQPFAPNAWSWGWWIAAVIAVSSVLCLVRELAMTRMRLGTIGVPAEAAGERTVGRPVGIVKRSACGTGGVGGADYNTGLHVGALFIILFVSGMACAFPMIAAKVSFLRIPAKFFFIVRHFGTGVLLATAFVHLIPTAFISLGDPCMSNFWTSDYPAMPGAIALAGIFFVSVIEMVFSPARHMCRDVSGINRRSSAGGGKESGGDHGTSVPSRPVRSMSISRQLSHIESAEIAISPTPADRRSGNRTAELVIDDSDSPPRGNVLTPEQRHKKEILQCMMLEVGILFHSVFIGMTLSVSTGKDFLVLLIAISFHQMFEGLALGARIAVIDWPKSTWQPWFMALAYGCTTPVGQALGLATHTLYDPASEFGLILVGTMNAVSSGLLIFASLIELLSEDLLSDESWVILRGKRRVYACLLIFFGAACMSLVGAWA